MTALRQDLTIEQGADYDTPFDLTDTNGNPDTLTGCAFVMQLRAGFDAPNAFLTLSSLDGSLAVDTSHGTVTPVLGYALTTAFSPGCYVYDLKERDASGHVRRRVQGTVTVTPQVTWPVPLVPLSFGQCNFSLAGNSGLAAGAL